MTWGQLAQQVTAARTPMEPVAAWQSGFKTRDLARVTDEQIAWQMSGQPLGGMSIPAVYASVRLIASTIDQLPVTVPNGDLPEWLRRPRRFGSHLDRGDLVQHVVTSMAVHGAGYLRCIRVGESWRIDALHPTSVQVEVSSSGSVRLSYRLDGRFIPIVPALPAEWEPDRAYLLPVPYLVTPFAPQGISPLQAARVTVEGYGKVEAQAADLLSTGTYSGGRLETDQDITADTARRYQETWVANRKTGALPVLGAGLRYINDLIDPADAQWLESRQFNAQQVAQMFGIPPDYLGMSMSGGSSSLSYNNSQDNNRRMKQNCLRAFTNQLEDALSLLLPPGRNKTEDQRVVFDYREWEQGGTSEAAAFPNTPVVDQVQ